MAHLRDAFGDTALVRRLGNDRWLAEGLVDMLLDREPDPSRTLPSVSAAYGQDNGGPPSLSGGIGMDDEALLQQPNFLEGLIQGMDSAPIGNEQGVVKEDPPSQSEPVATAAGEPAEEATEAETAPPAEDEDADMEEVA